MDRCPSLKITAILIALGMGMIHAHPVLAVSDEVIKQRIERDAAAAHRLSEAAVVVAVMQEFVVLRGKVNAYIQKCCSNRLPGKPWGVMAVEN